MSQAKTEPSSAEPSHQAQSPLLKGSDLERRFHELVSEWRAEVAPLSSSTAQRATPRLSRDHRAGSGGCAALAP